MKSAKANAPVRRTMPSEKAANLRREILHDRLNVLAEIVKTQGTTIEAQTKLIESQAKSIQNLMGLVSRMVTLLEEQDQIALWHMDCPSLDI